MFSPALQSLVQAFAKLPGIGQRSAQRLALHVLDKAPAAGEHLANTLQTALSTIQRCERCRMLTDTPICGICSHPKRNEHVLCVVEMPQDVVAIEQSNAFSGKYFVLGGHLSPIDGVGPDELGMPQLQDLVAGSGVEEVVLATNATVEGEATAYYIVEMLKPLGVSCTRLAHGIPLGGELAFVDGHTLARALNARGQVSD